MRRVLFVYPEHYMCVGIPGGVSILSALLKKEGHEVGLFDTCWLKPPDYVDKTDSRGNDKAEIWSDSEAIHRKAHGGGGTSDRGGLSIVKPTEYTVDDLVTDDPRIESYSIELQKKIDDFEPDVIALSCMTSTFDFACSFLEKIKHKATVVVGGVHPTIAWDDCMTKDCIDYAFIGEGDLCFPEFVNRLENGEDVSTVDSLVYRLPDGTVKKNPIAPRPDLNTLPCPDWGLFDERHLFRPYDGTIYKGSFYSQSRGCPMQCTYCVDPVESDVTGGSRGYFRTQRPDVTVAHLTELKEKFGATWYKFSDDTFLLPKKEHLMALRDGLKPLGIQFGCSIMTNTITEEKIKIVKDFGCVAMSVGVEAGNKDIRRTLNRRYTDESLIKNLDWVKKHGIRLSTFNIIGSPGETRDNVFETIELNRRLRTDACNVYIMFPYPGTPIQLKSGKPIRGEDGKLVHISEAKYLGLSEMGPDELQGLLDTFDLYLHSPKTLYPIIKFGEMQTLKGKEYHRHLHLYMILQITDLDQDLVQLNQEESAALEINEDKVFLPRCLKNILLLPETTAEQMIVNDSIRQYIFQHGHLNLSNAATGAG